MGDFYFEVLVAGAGDLCRREPGKANRTGGAISL